MKINHPLMHNNFTRSDMRSVNKLIKQKDDDYKKLENDFKNLDNDYNDIM